MIELTDDADWLDNVTILDTMHGIDSPISDDDEWTCFEACREEYMSGTYWWIDAQVYWEDKGGHTIRIDLDRAGWLRLKELCDTVIADIDSTQTGPDEEDPQS